MFRSFQPWCDFGHFWLSCERVPALVAIYRPMWVWFPLIPWPIVFSALCILSMVWSWSGRVLGQLHSWQWMADWLAARLFFCWWIPVLSCSWSFRPVVDQHRSSISTSSQPWSSPTGQPTHPSLSANDGHILACFVLKVQPPWLHFKVLVNFHLAWKLVGEGWQL